MKNQFEKLEDVAERFSEIEEAMIRPGIAGPELTKLAKERGAIEELIVLYRSYKYALQAHTEARAMQAESDPEIRDMAREELSTLEPQIAKYEDELTVLTLPQDPLDAKNVILEIRAGTGGEEAALFAADLFRMYTRYADDVGWRVEIMSSTVSDNGGYKEVIASVEGSRVYSRLKFESGVHRVQRVPATESQGRVHTSACTVAILPEADEVEIEINPADLEITLCRASGAGGQHVNTTDSAVRIVHKPTGLAVECQDERSQYKNKDRALKVLKARLYEQAVREQNDAISADRKSQVGSGDRSERIRTYNFPQGRITDHRINLTMYSLDHFIEGDIGKMLDALGTDHQSKLLARVAQA